MIKETGILLLLFSFLTFAFVGFGQSSFQPDRGDKVSSLLTRQNPWLDPSGGSQAPSSPGDSEIGEQRILSSADDYENFNFKFGERVMWTDNAALSDKDELSDIFSSTSLRLGYQPKLGSNTFGTLSASYSFFRYADHDELNFDSFQASLGVNHVFSELNDLSTWLRYNHTRILSAINHSELFTNHSVEVGAYYPIPLGTDTSAYVSYSSEFSIEAAPSRSQRNDHGFTLGFKYAPSGNLKFDAYYRIAYQDYRERGRNDLLQSLAVSTTTKLTKNIDLVFSASYSLNDSNLSGSDYKAGSVGALLGLKIEF